MARPRQYPNAAERQRAYRERLKAKGVVRMTEPAVPRFPAYMAQKTGQSERTIRRALQAAEWLEPEVGEWLREHRPDTNQTELLAIGRLPQREQMAAAQALLQPKPPRPKPVRLHSETVAALREIEAATGIDPADLVYTLVTMYQALPE